MSGPVFVIDAQGRPLMPLAKAHARKLLRSGKAQRKPHPALTIIQLTRTIETPTLRPILLGVVIRETAAEIFLLADGPQAPFPLMTIVINLSRRRWRAKRHRITHRQARIRRSIGQPVIGSVISTLWRLLPLSHIVLLRTPASPSVDMSSLQRLRRFLTVDNLRVAIVPLDGSAPSTFPRDLFTLLQEVAANPPAYTSVLAAAVIRPPQHQARLIRRMDDTDVPESGIGEVSKPPLIGIINHDSTNRKRVLEVPIAASHTGVIWRYVALAWHIPLQRWPLTSVVLLPLISRAAQKAVVLWEDDLDAFVLGFAKQDRTDSSKQD